MTSQWRPNQGQIALLEVVGPNPSPDALTGIVLKNGDRLLIDLGASPRLPDPVCEVTASFFNPEALYLVTAVATARDDPALIDLRIDDVNAVQRRAATRRKTTLPVSITAGAKSLTGETVDVAIGGCRVRVDSPLTPDVPLMISVGDEDPVTTAARVIDGGEDQGQWEYGLAFDEIDDADATRLTTLPG
jgi:hypothetical protein